MSYSVTDEVVFAAGGFWEAEDAFRRLHGVVATDVGYAGGSTADPTFHNIGDHVEAVRVYYDQRAISLEELLDTFWKLRVPAEEMGGRYDSRIFYLNDEQRRIANRYVRLKQEDSDDPVMTISEPLHRYWDAEEYHQHYLAKMRGEL